MDRPTTDPLFSDALRTGRKSIMPCCTADTHEFLVDGEHHLATRVAGHGWPPSEPGRIERIDDTGTVVEADGTECRVCQRPERDGG